MVAIWGVCGPLKIREIGLFTSFIEHLDTTQLVQIEIWAIFLHEKQLSCFIHFWKSFCLKLALNLSDPQTPHITTIFEKCLQTILFYVNKSACHIFSTICDTSKFTNTEIPQTRGISNGMHFSIVLFLYVFSDVIVFGCDNITLVGDGLCNDETNTRVCNYDGGDCCLDLINTDHCSECNCYRPGACVAGSIPDSVGDGFCNDETNNVQCYYDGLDCCRSPVNTTFCSNCTCHGELKI